MKYKVAFLTSKEIPIAIGVIKIDRFKLKNTSHGIIAFIFKEKKNNKYYFNGKLNFIIFNNNLFNLL